MTLQSLPGDEPLLLLTGATGYIGGRLLKALEEKGCRIRCLARRPEFLQQRVTPSTEVVKGDVLDPESLKAALKNIDYAYYLVHSLASSKPFEQQDRVAATGFVHAAHEAGVKRIIYLGGLGAEENLSTHLRSRQEVGRILRESSVTTIEFRASIIIGSGSLSFEMIRALVERLPVMLMPRWIRTKAQPIAIEDVISFLVASLDAPVKESAVFEIGGADRVSYMDIMKEYARQRGLKRLMIPVPLLTPYISSLWLGLVTPLYARVGMKLIESVRNETVVLDESANQVFGIRPRGIAVAVERALKNEDSQFAQTRWSDALSSLGTVRTWGGIRFGSRLVDSCSIHVKSTPAQAFGPIRRIGGATGWYFGDWLFQIRGWMDLLVGGPGMRRGRRDPENLVPGDTVDFFRVEDIEPYRLLRLFAEMRLPGRAWLQFEVAPDDSGSVIRQIIMFDPVGVSGLAYWYLLFPIHKLVFMGMLKGIAREIQSNREVSEP